MKAAAACFAGSVLAVGLSIGASAATVTTEVEGAKGISDQGCMQQLTIAVGDGENCMYNGGPPTQPALQHFGETTGPWNQIYYYDSSVTPQAFDPAYVPAQGDAKVEQLIVGTVTIDDNDTPDDGTDDLVSFELTLMSPGGGDVIRWMSGASAVDRYSSMTQVLTAAPVSSATPNSHGGFDYVIGSQGFPALLSFALMGPCLGQPFGSLDCGFSFNAPVVLDPDGWSGTSVAGLGSLEGNIGVRTVGTLENLECVAVAAQCTTSTVSFAPIVADPNRATAEDPGWDQLVLRVSTDGNGNVTTISGFDVQEYMVFGPPARCGSDPGAIIICNSWVSGYFMAKSTAGVPVDDADGDGVEDALDNCILVANPDQRDTDNDGYGNACDADLNNDGVVNFIDLAIFRTRFGSSDPDADLDGSGVVNFVDLAMFQNLFGKPPGPAPEQ